jgi:hypothetical protein
MQPGYHAQVAWQCLGIEARLTEWPESLGFRTTDGARMSFETDELATQTEATLDEPNKKC